MEAWRVAIVGLLVSCGRGGAPPQQAAAAPLEMPLLGDAAIAADAGDGDGGDSVLVPSVAEGCSIGGSLSPGDGVELCGVPRAWCFARIVQNARPMLASLKLSPGMSPDAHVVLQGGGVRVSGMVDVTQIDVRPAHAVLVARLFIPTKAPGRVREVRDGNATVELAVPELESDVPLRFTLPCDKLSTNELSLTTEEAARAAGLGRANPTSPTLASGKSVPIRLTSGEAPVARIGGQGQGIFVFAKTGGRSHVLVTVDGGFITGWIDNADIGGGRGYRSRTPRVRLGIVAAKKLRCDHEVTIDITIGGRIVRAATISARTSFDPDMLPDVLRRAGVELVHGATAGIDPAALADCKAD